MSIPGFDKKFSETESLKKFSVPLCEWAVIYFKTSSLFVIYQYLQS